MKNVMALVVFSMLTGQMAIAKCPSTDMSVAAKKIRLSGKVLIEEKSSESGLVTETESDTSKRFNKKSEEFQFVQEYAVDTNREILSPVYGFEGQGEFMVVVRDNNSCVLSVLGGDGEDISSSAIVPDSIKARSISIYRDNSTIVTISKVKKSKFLTK